MIRRSRVLFVFRAAVTVCILCVYSGAYGQQLKQYVSKGFGYSIDYPKDHSIKDLGNILIIDSPVKDKKFQFNPNVNIIVSPLTDTKMGLAEFVAWSKKELRRSQPDAVITEEKKDKLAGQQAYRIVYTLKQYKADFKFLQYIFLHDNKAYAITYTALADNFDKNLKSEQAIIKSLTLKK